MGFRSWIRLSVGLTAILSMGSANADDWRMFRKDTARKAASSDDLQFPLTQSWDLKSDRISGKPVLSTVAIFDGKAFFIAASQTSDAKKKGEIERQLLAVDLKSGKRLWTQGLRGARLHPYLSEDIGPAVSENGTVFAFEYAVMPIPCPAPTIVLKAFSAESGKLIAEEVVPARNQLDRFVLMKSLTDEDVLLEFKQKPGT